MAKRERDKVLLISLKYLIVMIEKLWFECMNLPPYELAAYHSYQRYNDLQLRARVQELMGRFDRAFEIDRETGEKKPITLNTRRDLEMTLYALETTIFEDHRNTIGSLTLPPASLD